MVDDLFESEELSFAGTRPQPIGEERRFFDECQNELLMLQWCPECKSHVFYPRSVCPSCWGTRLSWVEADGRGTIFTFTVQDRGPTGSEPPHVIAIIELIEGVRMMSRVIADPATVAIDQPVRVAFASIDAGGFKVPVFVPERNTRG